MVFLLALSLSLGLFTTSEYVRARGIAYFEQGEQLRRHRAVLEGRAGNPWQYRVLAPYLIEQVMRLLALLRVPRPVAVAFISFRVLQDTAVLFLAFYYYRRLGLSFFHALVGMGLLAWSISYSHYGSDLQFSTFFDLIFFLIAGLCLLSRRLWGVILVTFLAGLNRETSGLIPFLVLFHSVFAGNKRGAWREGLFVFFASFATYISVFVGLRLLFGRQALIVPYGHHPGADLLRFNLWRLITWRQLLATLNVVPIVAMLAYHRWPRSLRVFFWTVVPVWVIVHALGAVVAETRLFLVPQAMVFIPGALFGLGWQNDAFTGEAGTQLGANGKEHA
ncbi:MAG: hypothetical protein RML93_02865 [Anaerolineales bacterium]|nr:hypothetical protein [Anaerolineales bacterium]MDW8446215.1 hypothetical protein [Anaerolineales bacterium]